MLKHWGTSYGRFLDKIGYHSNSNSNSNNLLKIPLILPLSGKTQK